MGILAPNVVRNAEAQKAKGERIRAAQRVFKLRTQAAEAMAATAMTGETAIELRRQRDAGVAQWDAWLQQQLSLAFPQAMQRCATELAEAQADLDRERAAAEADYGAFCRALQDEKVQAAREAGWRQDRAEYLDGKQVVFSIAEYEDNNRYRVERGLRTPQEAQAELVLHARRSLAVFRDVLEQAGEVAKAEQIVREAGFEP